MASYSLVLKRPVARDLRPIPKADLALILKHIEALADGPRLPGSEKLSGQDRYRVRQGLYRIIYETAGDRLVVTVIKGANRRESTRK